ncbi:hypothetical protein FACS1894127_5170 [Clostridia bacterium]|nr:hypothetical protein FACS1894127_5170 [Clostridia bacterium]
MSTRKRFIAFFTTLVLLTTCVPTSPMNILAADMAGDTNRIAGSETGFVPYAAASPNAIMITQVAEYGQEVIGLALDLGSTPTNFTNLTTASMSALSVAAINTLEGRSVYNGIRTITNIYLNDEPEPSGTPTNGQYLIIELKHGFALSAPGSTEKAATLEFSNGVNKPLDLNYYVKVVRDDIPSLALNTVFEKKADAAGVNNLTVDKFTTGRSLEGLNYSLYTPGNITNDIPLVIWLHSESEGTYSPDGLTEKVTGVQLTANMGGTGWVEAQETVTTLAAYVLVPQADIKGSLTPGAIGSWDWRAPDAQRKDDERIDKLIKELIAIQGNKIDKKRIYIAGASDGGGQVLSQLLYSSNNPGAEKFAGGIVNCPPLSFGMGPERELSKADLDKIKDIPLWFFQAKDDPIVREPGTTNTVGILSMLDSQEVIYTHPKEVIGVAANAYNNHWIWIRPLNNQIEILGSGDTKLAAGLTSAANNTTAPTKPMNWLFSQTREEYTVKYEPGSGNIAQPSQTVKHGGKATPGLVTKGGELFEGWEDEPNKRFDVESTPILKGKTLTAVWKKKSQPPSNVANFDNMGGSRVIAVEIPDGDLITKPTDPTKPGHVFGGWYKDNTLQTGFDFSTEKIGTDVTLYAKWDVQAVLLFKSEGSVAGLEPMKPVTKSDLFSNHTPPDPTREGFTFKGWRVNGNDADSTTALNEDVNVAIAQWTLTPSYKVMFHGNGGSWGTDTVKELVVDVGNTPTAIRLNNIGQPVRTNFTFNGWFDSAAGGSKVNFNTFDTVSAGGIKNVYAIWTAEAGVATFKVTYDANGGTGTLTDPISPYVSGEAVKVLSPGGIVRAGYNFSGWNTAADGKGTAYAPGATFNITKDTTLYAVWTLSANTLLLKYDINGGSGTLAYPSQYLYPSGTSVKVITPTGISRTGYSFSTWNTKPDGTGTNRAVSSRFTITANTTLYAIWKSSGTGGGGGSNSGGSGSGQNKPGSNSQNSPNTPSIPSAPLGGFTDYDKISNWALSCFERLIRDGIFKGYTDGTLKPQGNVTRAEFTKLIVLGLKIKGGGSAKYFPDDVKAGDWYKEYVDIASAYDIVRGVSATGFAPNAHITRQDLAAMAYRALTYLKVGLTSPDGSKFPDDGRIADYAKDSVYGLKQIGIISGRTDGSFDPTALASREETAKIICGLIDYIAGKSGV